MTILFSPQAREDLREARNFLEKGDPEAAERLLDRLTEQLELLASGVLAGRQVELRDGRRVHTWMVSPYRVFYRCDGDRLLVVRIYHQARRPLHR